MSRDGPRGCSPRGGLRRESARPRVTSAALWIAVLAATGCGGSVEVAPDAGANGDGPGRPEASADVTGDEAAPAETGDAPLSAPGPITLVTTDVALLTDRLCDLDGDGLGDNVVAELGTPMSDVFATSLTSLMQGAVSRESRMLMHFPWVDDPTGPNDDSVTLVIFRGEDTDDPPDESDDFSGDEPFYIAWTYLDACGEPLYYVREETIEDGYLATPPGALVLAFGDFLVLEGSQILGTIAPGGVAFDVKVCGYATIASLGAGSMDSADLSALEVLVAGGALFGVPSVPGLEPDLDLDGDGLERFVTADDDTIEACIDGDATEIPGRDCWSDPRMADGFSFTVSLSGTSARFAGREADWEGKVHGDCEDGPPAQSVFDPV